MGLGGVRRGWEGSEELGGVENGKLPTTFCSQSHVEGQSSRLSVSKEFLHS